jgi:DNA polymerase-3 subunit epsilon
VSGGWAQGRLVAFDTETDGPNPEDARIITATILGLGGGLNRTDRSWLLRTERPIDPGATAIHGITTERANADGVDRTQAVEETTSLLLKVMAAGTPVVAFNAAFDFTVLDRECRRLLTPSLSSLLKAQDREVGPVIDPHVIDKAVDKFRKGKRTLGVTCQVYGIDLGEAHDATADALGAARLAYKLAMRYEQVGSADLWDLHRRQVAWRAEQSAGLQDYFRNQGKNEVVDPSWPLREAQP